ncbi:acyltransferase family protein [Trinickia dinghuensis]|uniref:acyltransferase family protein n=1 Tax=Trinickia dinghuensis TaxID=2291023 RepID=UPI0015F1B3FC|nr:acyltransferase family protein [Trinickia dinghuensis]
MGSSPNHRADIDGLRAVAVLSVIAYHAFPTMLSGGFVGVDIFFVISGYLIGGILLRGLKAETFSFIDFYVRRVRRIFPALILVLVFCLALGWKLMLADEYRSLAEQAGSGAGFSANILLWMQTGYFDAKAIQKPLLHLWSLGIEEQFYIAWPLILFIAHRAKLNVFLITALLAVASFVLNLQLLHDFPAATFYLPHTRIWELLIGCLLAYTEINHPTWINQGSTVTNLKALIGFGLIIFSATKLTNLEPFPGWRAMLPVAGGALLISAGPTSLINRYVLSMRPMVWVGLISYPLYLWHWPLLSFAHIDLQHAPSTETRLILVAISFALATMTYWLVEKRIRYRRHILVPAALATVMALVAGQSYATYRTGGFPSRTARFEKVEKAIGEWDYPTKDMTVMDFHGMPIRSRKTPSKHIALFVGDSQVEQYWPRVDELVTDEPGKVKSVVFATLGGCPAIPGVEEPKHAYCSGYTDKVKQYMMQNPDIDTVYVGSYWLAYLDLVHGYMIQTPTGSADIASDAGRPYALAALTQLLIDYKSTGKRVVLILQSPVSGALDPRSLVGRSLYGFSIKEGGLPTDQLLFRTSGLRAELLKVAHDAGVEAIDPTGSFCPDDFCAAWQGQEPIYRDSAHLRASFMRHFPSFIDQAIAAR